MHELSICLNIIDHLSRCAKEQHFTRVTKLRLEVGELAGIELDALQFSFPIAAKNTLAENAELDIITISGQANCRPCGKLTKIKHLSAACQHCGEYDYELIHGQELRILDLVVSES